MLILADNAFGTLGGNLLAGDTSLSLSSGHGARFPALSAGDVLPLCLIDASGLEEIYATARSGDTLTIVRARGGTVARAFSIGAKVQCRLSSEALKRLAQQAGMGVDASGTDTYVATWSPAPIGYVKGVTYRFFIANANTGAATINLGGLGAIAIKKNVNEDLSPGDLPAGGVAEMVYDGTNMQLLNPATGLTRPGDIKYSAIPEDQDGWLSFSDTPVSRSTFAALFAKMVKTDTGNVTSASKIIDSLNSTTGLKAGMLVSGTGIPSGARIDTIDSSTQVTLTHAATATNSGVSLEFHWWGNGDGSTTFNLPRPCRMMMPAGSSVVVERFTQDAIDTSLDTIKVAKNKGRWIVGMEVQIGISGTGPTTSPAGLLDNGDTAYVIPVDDETIKLASTRANAQAGTAINITVAGSGNFTLTHTLTTRIVGEDGGEENHAQSISEMPEHSHSGGVTSVASRGIDGGGFWSTGQTGTRGSGEPMNNMPPYQVGYGLIKT